MKPPTILDVALVAGVSKSTVSRVLNADPMVSAEARELVSVAINALNYRPNVAARSMRGARSHWIALLYQNPGADYMRQIQLGAMAGSRDAGHLLSVHACDAFGSALVQEVRAIVDQLQPAGVILTPPLCDVQPVLKLLQGLTLRYARLGPILADRHGVSLGIDEAAAMCELTERVIKLGHRELAYVGGLPLDVQDPRRAGFDAAVAAAGLELPASRRTSCGFRMQRALAWALKSLAAPRPPTAILAANDDMAVGVLHAAYQLGIAVPQALSVAGFDDTYVAQLAIPRLTTVRQPLADLGRQAALWLAGTGPRRATSAPVVLPYELVPGGSTAPPADAPRSQHRALQPARRAQPHRG